MSQDVVERVRQDGWARKLVLWDGPRSEGSREETHFHRTCNKCAQAVLFLNSPIVNVCMDVGRLPVYSFAITVAE